MTPSRTASTPNFNLTQYERKEYNNKETITPNQKMRDKDDVIVMIFRSLQENENTEKRASGLSLCS
jgi:hypothetical protein